VDIDHTWISDITATLTAPDGTAVEVLANSGGSRDFIVGTFASDGTGYAEMGYSTSTTSTEYTQPDMTPFVGGAAEGDWSLVLDDVYGGDDGTLNSWGLTFTCE